MTKAKKGGLLLSVAALLSLAGCTNPETSSSVVSTPASSESSVVTPKYDVTKITWSWEESASGYTAKATIPCTNGLPNKVIDATVTSKKTDPTCTVAGSIVYTAKIQFEGNEYQDKKTITVDALGHEYDVTDVVWTWTPKADGSGYDVSAKIPCKRGDDEVVVNDIAVTSKRTEPTCTEDGSIVYTATGTYNDQTLTDTKTDPIEKTGHSYDYSKATFVWTKVEGGEGYTVVAKVPCSKGDDTKEVAAEVAETSRTAAKCTADGSVTYTATIKDEQNAPYTDTKTDVLAALGHDFDYENLAWEWTESADGYTAKATATCARDQAKTSADATVTVQTTEATCEEAGQKVYTAKATFNGTEYSATKTVTLPALGHNLQLVAAKDASINATGNSAYYKCDRCGKLFSDEKGTTEISAVPTISWVHVAAIDPTQSARGFKEFYLKSGTGEVSFTAPENATYSTITLTDEEKASFINNDTNKVTIPSFDELNAALNGHDGTMPYDYDFLNSAKAVYDTYSDNAKAAYGKDVDAMFNFYSEHYGVANKMTKMSSGWDAKNLSSNINAFETDPTFGSMHRFTRKTDVADAGYTAYHIDNASTIEDGTKALVFYVKGLDASLYNPSANHDINSTDGANKAIMYATGGTKYNASLIEQISDEWVAFYFESADLITALQAEGALSVFSFNPLWGSDEIFVTPIYGIKTSGFYGNDAAAFPAAGTPDGVTQNYNNVSFSYGAVKPNDTATRVGFRTFTHPLYGPGVMEGKGSVPIEIGYKGVDGTNNAKGNLKKMVDGTLTSAYFYFYSSVDSLTVDFRYNKGAGGSENDWINVNNNYTITGIGWHKIVISNKNVLAELNAADGTKTGYIWFNVKAGNESTDIMRATGIYGTLAA
ncbi:MAG: hypothetical protein PUC66_03900 [Erysipelotrichaceae bacterium]|nr:hypothetical protein [Erysipelotrichaceae bacterium]